MIKLGWQTTRDYCYCTRDKWLLSIAKPGSWKEINSLKKIKSVLAILFIYLKYKTEKLKITKISLFSRRDFQRFCNFLNLFIRIEFWVDCEQQGHAVAGNIDPVFGILSISENYFTASVNCEQYWDWLFIYLNCWDYGLNRYFSVKLNYQILQKKIQSIQ